MKIFGKERDWETLGIGALMGLAVSVLWRIFFGDNPIKSLIDNIVTKVKANVEQVKTVYGDPPLYPWVDYPGRKAADIISEQGRNGGKYGTYWEENPSKFHENHF